MKVKRSALLTAALLGMIFLGLLATVPVFAHGDDNQPQCGPGQITIQESVWVPRVCTGGYFTEWSGWEIGDCPQGSDESGDDKTCKDEDVEQYRTRDGQGPWSDWQIGHCPQGSDESGGDRNCEDEDREAYSTREWVPEECSGGYWTDPVCADPTGTPGPTSTPEPTPIPGCTDPAASNYDPEAEADDESCIYPTATPLPTPEPGRVNFGVEASWCRDEHKPDRKVIFHVSPAEGGYISMGGNNYADGESDFFSGGTHGWVGIPNEGFEGKDSGTISFGDCEGPEEHPATGPTDDLLTVVWFVLGGASLAILGIYRLFVRGRGG